MWISKKIKLSFDTREPSDMKMMNALMSTFEEEGFDYGDVQGSYIVYTSTEDEYIETGENNESDTDN